MNLKRGEHVCSECLRKRNRCRISTVNIDGSLVYVCRQCWKEKEYDRFLYKHLEAAQ